jgi:DNA repair protein RecO (recombination protein O)
VYVLSTPAIILRAVDYGESDRIVTFLTRDAGKLSGIAKGAKRSQRRFGGALGLFAHVTLQYRHRPGAELAFLERTLLIRPWRSLLDSLERYAAAIHVVELADKMTLEHEVGDDLYQVVLAALARLDAAEPSPLTLRLFELAALAACGYRAELEACVACRRPFGRDGAAARIAPTAGGATCGRCADPDGASTALSLAALDCLVRMQRAVGAGAAPAGCAPEQLYDVEATIARNGERPVANEIAAALAALLAPHLRGRLRGAELMRPILRRHGEEV